MDAAIARLTRAVEGLLAEGRLVGLSVGSVRGGQLVYSGAFGALSMETREPGHSSTWRRSRSRS